MLAARYTTSKPLTFTRAMLWDMETRKAAYKAVDERLTAVFEHMAADPWLPEHTEIYIRHNLGIELTRN